MTSTNYFFDVSPDALEGALDRFAGFFYEPLFNEDCTEREIKAVDSEHKKNLQNDVWVRLVTPLDGELSCSASSSWRNTSSLLHMCIINSGRATTSLSGPSRKQRDEIQERS